MPKIGTSAAWRISLFPALAYALGTAITFAIVFFFVAKGVRDRSDAWLTGEAAQLGHVAATAPRERLYNRVVGEVAELSGHELLQERNSAGQNLNAIFLLSEDPVTQDTLWVGPGTGDAFRQAIASAKLTPGKLGSIRVEGWSSRFRVVEQSVGQRTIYMGLSELGDLHTLQTLALLFLTAWLAVVLLGFAVSYSSARGTLERIDHISETVARIDSDLGERLSESTNADEISRLAKTFNNMLDRLQASVNQLRSVTDSVAHEIKTPVTSIRGTLEAALYKEPDSAWRDSVGEAIEGLDRLTRLLNTVLDLAEAKASALKLDPKNVDLSDVVRQTIEIYRPAMAEREHELVMEVEDHLLVPADLPLLHRAVSNLLENELAHLPLGCLIQIRLHARQNSAELEIEDNGPGFPPEVAVRAFQRFVRGEHSAGHGLGLAFVDAVVQAHGGAVRISDARNGGALLTLSLPLAAVHAPSPAD